MQLVRPLPRHSGISTWAAGGVIACLTMLLGSCAPARSTPIETTAINPSAGGEAAVSRGTILAMRPVELGSAASLGRLVRPTKAANARPSERGQAVDFIVHEAGGGTIAVVQENELRFQVGEPVLIIRGDRTRLSRPGA